MAAPTAPPLVVSFDSADATPEAVQALAEHIRYLNGSDDPSTAPRTVTFTLVDGDGTANGGTDTATAHATIDVVAVNDAPVVVAPTTTINFDAIDASSGQVDGAALSTYLAAYGIIITAGGSGADPVIADDRLIYGGGIVEATSGHNVFGENGGHPVSYTLTFAQPVTSFEFDRVQENAGPSGSSYPPWSATAYDSLGNFLGTVGENGTSVFGSSIPAQHYALNGPQIDHVVFSGDDQGFYGFANVVTDNWVLNYGGTTTAEDTPLTIDSVSVSDADAGSAQIMVTLAVDHGTLRVDETGLDFGSTNNGATIDLFGSQAAIDAALAGGVTYTPDARYNGADALTVTADDQGNTGTGGAQTASQTVAIDVTPVPSFYWTGAYNGDWFGTSLEGTTNWTSDAIPGSTDTAFIGVDQNGGAVAVSGSVIAGDPIDVHSFYLRNGVELDATDLTLGGNLAVDNATLASYGADLTIHSVGGSATVSADNGNTSQITAVSGSLVFNDIDGDFTVSALTSDPQSGASEADVRSYGGDLTIGNIGGDLTVAATGDVDAASSANLVASDGYLSIGAVGGSVSMTADNYGYAEIYANHDVTIGTNQSG